LIRTKPGALFLGRDREEALTADGPALKTGRGLVLAFLQYRAILALLDTPVDIGELAEKEVIQ
jgi:hypothetical protein